MTAPLSPPNPDPCAPGVRPGVVRAALLGLAMIAFVGTAPAAVPDPQGAPREQGARTNWPQWRGPLGNGVAPGGAVPVHFGAEEGVLWKVAVPGRGQSSPIVWDDLVFLTTAVPMDDPELAAERPRRRRRPPLLEHEFRLVAYRRVDGGVAWSRTATTATPHERYHRTLSSYANPSPVTDGIHVYAFFGSRGLYAFRMDGTPVWSRDFGVDMETFGEFGEAASPALHGDTIVVQFDHQGQSFIEALDSATGESRWRRLRDEGTTWASPYIVEVGGQAIVVASGGNAVIAYDLQTGDVVWESPGMTPRPIPTPVAGGDLLFATSGSTERRVHAIALKSGDGTRPGDVVWRLDKAAPYNPSPLLWDDELYLVRDGGLNAGTSRLSMIDARTGEPHYLHASLPASYTVKASPVGAGEHVYLATEEGDVLVVRRGPDFEVVAVNEMGEPFIASPAIAHGQIFLRGRQHLWAIGRDR